MAEIQISGLAELKKAMQELPGKIEGKIAAEAMRAGLKLIGEAAKSYVPVNSGALRDSIKVKIQGKSKKFGWVRMHLTAGDKKAYYAHMVEYGTASYYTGQGETVGQPYTIKAKKSKGLFFGGINRKQVIHPGIKPQPFMRPAFDQNQQAAIDKMVAHMSKAIPKEFKKAGI